MSQDVVIRTNILRHLTPEQLRSIAHIAEGAADVLVSASGFDLPQGYIAFEQRYSKTIGATIYGGIAPDGQIST